MSVIYEARHILLDGMLVTIKITVLSAIVVYFMAFIAGLAAISRFRVVRVMALLYTEFFRGVSLLVQLFWLFFVLPFLGINLQPLVTAIIGFGLCLGAYGAEIVRGAILAVPRGQIEAAIALNFTRFQRMRKVILPQAIQAMLPPFGNLTIELLKATALVSLITIQDLTFRAHTLTLTTMRTIEVFTVVLVVYFVLAMCISLAFKWLERRAGVGMERGVIR